MISEVVVQARVEEEVQQKAAAIFAAAGLSLSDAFRILLLRTAAERALPFDPLTPNEETVQAMYAARRGDLTTFDSVDALMHDLHADD